MAQSTIDKIRNEMIEYFGSDRKRIDHALKVLDFARRINSVEKADPLIVEAAAVLHDIGIRAAEKKYGSGAGMLQEIEGPPIARKILQKNGFTQPATDHICAIVANHHSGKNVDTPEFRVVWDSDWLVNIPDEFDLSDKDALGRFIERVFKTAEGKRIAKAIFIQNHISQ